MVEMMAIGDSLFNGVRSLTINEPLAQWSAPAQVAKALGIPFAIPDYPRNVVINFEQWLREFPNIIGIGIDIESNISFWDKMPASQLPAFDNIAIASTSYADMYSRTWKTGDNEITELKGQPGTDITQIGPHLADLFFAFNTRFLLNPTSDRNAPALSPLDIVAARKPKRLLISIGANNGLWNMGFAAEASAGRIDGDPGMPFDADDINQLEAFVAQLKALPPQVEHIYWNALPLPSVVADMMPVGGIPSNKPGPGSYYPVYENAFGFSYNKLTGDQVKANDTTVAAVNAKVAQLIVDNPRIHIVPVDSIFSSYNFKTNAAAQAVKTPDGKIISNIMLEGPELLFPNYWQGGLMGLDGMHPTIVGYAIMAQEILKSITQHEGIVVPVMPDVNLAYQADTLLQKVPISWDLVLDLSLDIRRACAGGLDTQAPSGIKYDAVKGLLNALRFKYD